MSLRENWNRFSKTGVWILSIIGIFLIPPPAGAMQYEQKGAMRGLAVFTITLVVALALLPMRKWNKKKHAWTWWSVAAAALVLSVASLLCYDYLTSRWTCMYAGVPYVVGSEFTEHGKAYVHDNPQRVTCSDWLMAHAGNAEEIWTRDSIMCRRYVLTGFYILMLPCFTLAILAALHARSDREESLKSHAPDSG